ncbi:MAG: hypothetical protein ACFFCS_26740 [Candidatus Hodarchaeota archaeon]
MKNWPASLFSCPSCTRTIIAFNMSSPRPWCFTTSSISSRPALGGSCQRLVIMVPASATSPGSKPSDRKNGRTSAMMNSSSAHPGSTFPASNSAYRASTSVIVMVPSREAGVYHPSHSPGWFTAYQLALSTSISSVPTSPRRRNASVLTVSTSSSLPPNLLVNWDTFSRRSVPSTSACPMVRVILPILPISLSILPIAL